MVHSTKSALAISAALLLLTVAVYLPALRHGFISFDDDRYVTDNPHVRAGLQLPGITWAFTTLEQANWHPLTWISHELDCQLYALHPTGHHATSVVLHAVDAVLLFLILFWFTGSLGRSAIVAALFAVHPLNVESVAWVAERKSVLSMLFLLFAVAAYGWYVKKPGIGRYATVVLFFAAGLMSKPMVITLPFLLLLLDAWPLGRMPLPNGEDGGSTAKTGFAARKETVWRLLLEKAPLFVLSAGSAVMTMMVQKAGGAVISTKNVPLALRVGNSILCYGLYIKKMVWPWPLVILYPYPRNLPRWEVAAAAIFLVVATWAVVKLRTRRYLVVGWFWYLGAMVPMIGLVQVGNQAMADRYAYLPMIGLFVMVVWGAADLAAAFGFAPGYAAATGLAVVAAFGWVTRAQLDYWKDDHTLWSHALAVTSQNFVAECNLGLALMREGQRAEAVRHFRQAAEIEPGDPTIQFNLGVYAQEEGDTKQAVERYEAVLGLTPDKQLRASAFANIGTIYFSMRDYPRAKQNFEEVLKLDRAFPVVVRDLGLIAGKDGNWHEAAKNYTELVTLEPSDVNFFLLAQALHQLGRDNDALLAYQEAVRRSKDINQTKAIANQMEAL